MGEGLDGLFRSDAAVGHLLAQTRQIIEQIDRQRDPIE